MRDLPEPVATPSSASWSASWQDHAAVRLVLFGAVFACGLIAIDVAAPPRADDLRFLWLAAAPFALAFVVRLALWPVAAVVAYHVGTWAPNAAYDRPLPSLGDLQALFPGMTAIAGLGIVWTVWGFRAGYGERTGPPVFGRAPVRGLRLRLLAATALYAAGLGVLLAMREAPGWWPALTWLALGPLALAPLARARLWPFAAGLVAAVAAGVLATDAWTRTVAVFDLPAAARGWVVAGMVAVAAALAWALAGIGFLAMRGFGNLAAWWRTR